MSPVSPRRFFPVLAVVAPVAIAAACFGPTEVTVTVTTDLACGVGPRTAIFKGLPFGEAPDAETSDCKPDPSGDAKIGSLVFVPSGSANGRAGVRVVLARGRSTTECDAHPEDCIVATRSFSFVKHLSRRVPIRMLSECLGRLCPEGQTCGPGGECVSDEVTCEADDCALDGGAGDGGDVVVDAGADGDAGEPSLACLGPNGDGVLAQAAIGVTVVAAALTTIEHVFVEGATHRLMRVAKSGGDPVEAFSIGARGTFVALTTLGAHWAALYDVVTPKPGYELRSSALDVPYQFEPLTKVKSVAAWIEAGLPVGYVGGTSDVLKVMLTKPPTHSPFLDVGADAIAVDSNTVYTSLPDGITATRKTNPKEAAHIAIMPPAGGSVVFASNGASVFVAGLQSDKPTIHRMNGLSAPMLIASSSEVVTSLAAEAVTSPVSGAPYVYWTDGSSVRRRRAVPVGSFSPDETVYTPTIAGARVEHVLVDSECVYVWESAGFVQQSVLRGIQKPKPQNGP